MSAYSQAGVFLRGDPHRFGKGLEEIAVVRKAAAFIGFGDAHPFVQQGFRDADPSCGDIFVDGGAGGGFEDPADVGLAQVEMLRQLGRGDGLGNILVDICQDLFHLSAVPVRGQPRIRAVRGGNRVNQHQKLQEGRLFQHIVGVPLRRGDLIDIVEKTVLLFLVQGDPVGKAQGAMGKAKVQIRFRRGKPLHIIRMDAYDNALVEMGIHLRQLMAFVLVDDEQIPWLDVIKFIVDQKLFSPGNGIIQFITIMDVHVHGFFLVVKMGDGKGMVFQAVFYRKLTGRELFHGSFLLSVLHGAGAPSDILKSSESSDKADSFCKPPFLRISIQETFKICKLFTVI